MSSPEAEGKHSIVEQLDNLPSSALVELVTEAFSRLRSKDAADVMSKLSLTVRLDYDPIDIRLVVSASSEYPRRLACQKEPWTVEWIEGFVGPRDVFYDIGANVGAYSLLAAMRTKNEAQVFAIEPAFPNFPQLCRNIVLNGCQESIVPLPVAIGEGTQLKYFNYADLGPGSALHTLGDHIDYRGHRFKPIYRQPTLSYGIDELIDTFRLPLPHHIKIDVDGTEMDVLKGASRTLATPEMKSIMIEICELRVPATEISKFLRTMDWRMTQRFDRRDAQGRTLDVSYLQFVKN